MSSDLVRIAVGERFEHDITDEGMSIILVNGVPLLTFNFAVNRREIATFLNGDVSFGLVVESNVLFLLFKIEGFLDWSDLAFTIHLAGDEKIADVNAYLPFHLVLVDPIGKIVQGLRMVTVSPDFRARLVRAIEQQGQVSFNTIAYYQQIGRVYDEYPSASDLLKQAVIVEHGGKTLPEF